VEAVEVELVEFQAEIMEKMLLKTLVAVVEVVVLKELVVEQMEQKELLLCVI
jgi:hypothetical protein